MFVKHDGSAVVVDQFSLDAVQLCLVVAGCRPGVVDEETDVRDLQLVLGQCPIDGRGQNSPRCSVEGRGGVSLPVICAKVDLQFASSLSNAVREISAHVL